MKILKCSIIGLVCMTALFLGINLTAFGQTATLRRGPTTIIPLFTNNPVAMFVITNLLAEPPPELSLPDMRAQPSQMPGTYWTLTGAPVPLPFNPFPDLPVYEVSTNHDIIIDDRSVDYAALDALQQLENEALGLTNQPMNSCPYCDSDLLWIKVPTNSLTTPDYFTLELHNTSSGQSYDILTASSLVGPWATELVVTGAVGNVTETQVPVNNRTNLFVRARTSVSFSFYLISPPLSQRVCEYDTVTFTVETGGNTNLTFQWTLNGDPIAGATNASYTINSARSGGDYAVIISDGTNSIVTGAATLSVGYATGDPALVWVEGARQDYTFRSGVTYYIGSPVELHGETTIMGGAVLKFDSDNSTNSTLIVLGGLTCKTEPYNPAILTSLDDDSAGTYIFFSSGYPQPAFNGVPYLEMACATSNSISNLRFCFADWGVTTPIISRSLDVWDCQFYDCNFGVVNLVAGSSTNSLHNVLLSLCDAAVAAATNAIAIKGEQITADVNTFCLAAATPQMIALTNGIVWGNALAAMTVASSHVAMNPADTNFVAAGEGYYYLAVNTPLRGNGTSVISPRLKAELQHKTTAAPLMLPDGLEIDGEITLSPQVPRYTNGAPDIGYYYDVLDYSITELHVLGGKVAVLPGTAIGVRDECDPNGAWWTKEGVFVGAGGSFISHGLPDRPNIFTAADSVQETPNLNFAETIQWPIYFNFDAWWPAITLFVSDCQTNDATAPTLDFRFSNFYLPPLNQHFCGGLSWDLFLYSISSTVYLTLQDCALHGGQINFYRPDGYDFPLDTVFGHGAITWKNSLFDNVNINLDPTIYWVNQTVNCDEQVQAFNNLFRNAEWLSLGPFPASSGNWVFEDNLFDKVHLVQDTSQPLDFDYNGYWPVTDAELFGGNAGDASYLLPSVGGNASGDHEQVLDTAPPYAAGPFGNYYLSAVTPLYQAGSRSATDAGLTQYTTFANQQKDNPNQPVNIGLHYVAAANSLPLDSDGDGVPDYVEVEYGTNPNNPMTDGVTPDAYSAVYDDVDLSGDGLTGAAKRMLGLDPLSQDNPLSLSLPPLTNSLTGILIIPFSLNTNLDDATPLSLYVDGQEANDAVVQKTDQNWFVRWDTTTAANGPHILALKYNYQSELEQTFCNDAFGAPLLVNVNNPLTFTTFSSTFTDLLVIDAVANNGASYYSINVYDCETSNLLTTLSGSVSSGLIETSWDLTDGNGNVMSDNALTCEFSFTDANNQSMADKVTKTYAKVFKNPANSRFTAAWGFDPLPQPVQQSYQVTINHAVVNQLACWYDPFPDPQKVYQVLPNGGSGNVNNPGGEISFNFSGGYPSSKQDFLTALNNSGNVFWSGHGKPTAIFPNPGISGPTLKASEIAATLGNPTRINGSNYIYKPYKLVLLVCCNGYSPQFASAFGIVDFARGRSTNTVQYYTDAGKIPQAYVGWPCNEYGVSGDPNSVIAEDTHLTALFNLWQRGFPISYCMDQFGSSMAIDFPAAINGGTPNDKRWELSGCADLKTSNRNP